MLAGELPGYVYQRDGHPNADLLATKCRELHGAERVAITSSGMSALSAVVLSQLVPGDHVIASDQLYGRSLTLLAREGPRWGLGCTLVDTCDLAAVAAARTPRTRLVVVETISNPRLHVADIAALAGLAHEAGALLLVDNTFATPALCRPLEWGADLVLESVTKLMNGHSDVILGLVAGRAALWERLPLVLSAWGLSSGPFDCWLAYRGLATLALRAARASDNALAAARFLRERPEVEQLDYPGLPDHPHHGLAARQFGGRFGAMVTVHLRGDRTTADAFIAAGQIPFCPSLGETATTLSHPVSTSQRGLTPSERARLGIRDSTIRLSIGIESPEYVIEALRTCLEST